MLELSIQDLGAIGKFVGALIIVVTLVYLAIQNKQNQKLLLSNAFQARANIVIDLYREAAMRPVFAAFFERNAAITASTCVSSWDGKRPTTTTSCGAW